MLYSSVIYGGKSRVLVCGYVSLLRVVATALKRVIEVVGVEMGEFILRLRKARTERDGDHRYRNRPTPRGVARHV